MPETVKQVIARTSGGGSAPTRYAKSAQTSARNFVNAMRGGNTNARKALGLRSSRSKQALNLSRRKSLGGKGG